MRARRARVLRALCGVAGFALVATALIGFAHTEHGRPLLALLRGAPGCPIDLDALEPAALERQRVRALQARRGTEAEQSREVLGFTLGTTHKQEALAQLEARGGRCELERNGSVLRCTEVARALSSTPIDELHLQFDEHERLVAVDVYRRHGCVADALEWLARQEAHLAEHIGPATATSGERSAASFESGTLRRVASEYRYRTVVAQISAMRLANRLHTREQYQWLPTVSSTDA